MITFVALGLGFVVGSIARLLSPGEPRLTWAETIVLGLAGAAAGTAVVELLGNRDLAIDLPSVAAATIASVLGALALLAIAELVRKRRGLGPLAERRLPADARETLVPTATLMANGESGHVEFKSTARRNLRTGERDDQIELVIAKTVAGFLNAAGGTLLIGVDDTGAAVGVEADFEFIKHADEDHYELWLRDYLQRCLGAVAHTKVRVSFERFDATTVCRVDVEPSDQPVFLDVPKGPRTADLYVRAGNSTRKLATDEAIDYDKQRFS